MGNKIMRGKQKNAKRHRNNKSARNHTNAQSNPGMQRVDTWNVFDIFPVVVPANQLGYNPDLPSVIQLVAGVNRWAWDLRQGGTAITGETL